MKKLANIVFEELKIYGETGQASEVKQKQLQKTEIEKNDN